MGWTLREAEAIDLWDLRDIHESWEECPPLEWMVAGYLGIRAKQKAKRATPMGLRTMLDAMTDESGTHGIKVEVADGTGR